MKVSEEDTDRQAYVHIYVEEKVDALAEYGQYIDARDGAICCYVPVEEGHTVRIGGQFSGTTLVIAYDAVVDGVHRKASSYIAKAVNHQKNKKLNTESFLYNTKIGIAETAIHVAPLSGVTTSKGEDLETIGTIELRLYVTRQLGVSHTLSNVENCFTDKSNTEDAVTKRTIYQQIEPTFRMVFEENCSSLENNKLTREQRRMAARRPGTEPWAVFRFHYRSKEAIVEHDLKQTFDPTNKSQIEPHILKLEPVQPLAQGTKPHKDDGDSSTRASSPTPVAPSSATTKRARKNPASKTPTPVRQQQAESASPSTSTLPPSMTSTTNTESTKAPELTLNSVTHEDVTEDLRARIFAKPPPKSPSSDMATTTANNSTVISGTKSTVLPSNAKPNSEKVTDIANTTLSPNKGGERRSVDQINTATTEAVEKSIKKAEQKEHTVTNDTIAVATPKGTPTPATNDSAAKASSLSGASSMSAKGATTKPGPLTTPITKRNPQVVIPGANRPGGKPTRIGDTILITPKKTGTTTPPITPTERAAESTDPSTPENKRPKSVVTSNLHLSPATMARIAPSTPSPRPASIELKVAEQRKKLQAVRQKRLETAKKQEELDKKMEPYKKRMAEELERLNREMMEEEAAVAEDEEHFNASMEMLAEFEQEGACD